MLLEITDLAKSFAGPEGPIEVLRGIDLSLGAGQTLALTGESGSGKSTLLHLVGGLDRADGGRIVIDGTDITGLDDAGRAALRRHTVSIVFQQFNLIPSLDVGRTSRSRHGLRAITSPTAPMRSPTPSA